MPEYKYMRKVYNCSKIGKNVNIKTKLLIHRSGNNGQIDKEFPVKHECDHHEMCGVATQNGLSTNYDWKQCVHPDLKQ